jgi:plasmid stability protein
MENSGLGPNTKWHHEPINRRIAMEPNWNQNGTEDQRSRADTMASITIKNIPDHLYEALKDSAALHHRSINGEVIDCLERTLLPRQLSQQKRLELARRARIKVDPELMADPDRLKSAIREGLE